MNPFFVRQFVLVVSLLVSVFAFAAPTSFTVEVTGKGKPMIFIPGLASSGEVWKDTVAQFANRY